MTDVSALVLAGGKSSRMGIDKAFLELEGRTLLERALELARAVSDDVRIVGPPEKLALYGPVIEDVYVSRGPLAGIHAALATTTSPLNLMLAVDLPFVQPAFLNFLIQSARDSGAVVTVPKSGAGYQPLCAVYTREFAVIAEAALKDGRNKIDTLFQETRVHVIDETGLARFGFDPAMFENLNTPEDWGRVSHAPPIETSEQHHHMPADAELKPYIEFKHVSKAFGSNRVLDDVSFDVMPGETVCILGRSGVGKSVSLHNIMGFLKPDSGRVIVAYEDITDYSEPELERIRKKVTMVFQNGALFDSLTVGENVAFPLRERADLDEEQIYQVVDGLLEMVGVRPMRDMLPSELSTGMKRSVAIARALAAQPEAILYDEPTTMVDPMMAQLLGDLIKKLKFQLKLTSIVVTHDMRLAKKLADRVMFLHEGRALFFGPYSELERSDNPIIRQFLKLDELHLPGLEPDRPGASA